MRFPKYILCACILLCSCENNGNDQKGSSDSSREKGHAVQKTKAFNADSSLMNIWSAFQTAVSKKDIGAFKKLSIDTIEACGVKYSASQFITKCFNEVFDTALINKFGVVGANNQIDKTVERDYFSHQVLQNASEKGDVITLKQFQITKAINQDDGAWTVTFDFLKTKNGYKFFGTDSYGGPICCR